jgi:hypothetical protein
MLEKAWYKGGINMNENIMIIAFEPMTTMVLIERARIRTIFKTAIKEAIKEAEKNHRVYKLEDLLDELDDED